MNNQPGDHSPRKNTYRLSGFDYSREGLYFVTLCCKERACCLGDIRGETTFLSKWGQIVDTCWLAIPTHFPEIRLHEYVIMPNHIHGIVEIHLPMDSSQKEDHPACGTSMTLSSVIRGFKAGVTKRIGKSIWQPNYYDHVIRTTRSHENIVEYIQNNPIRWTADRFYEISTNL